MSDWLHNLPVPWMALVIFGFTYLLAALIYAIVAKLAAGGWGKSFKAISVGMLPSLGIIFGLFVAFTASQVWGDNDRATARSAGRPVRCARSWSSARAFPVTLKNAFATPCTTTCRKRPGSNGP
jgi:hypothetical protein